MHDAFKVHKLNKEGMGKAKLIAKAYDDLVEALYLTCPGGREWSLAMEHLELACFFAKKAMATQKENQDGA